MVSLLILLHELGHFLAAKRMGIPIARFSVGLGPKLWGFKMGKTEVLGIHDPLWWLCDARDEG